MIRRPPRSTLFPYTSSSDLERAVRRARPPAPRRADELPRPRGDPVALRLPRPLPAQDRKSTRLNSQSRQYLVCRLLLEKKNTTLTYSLPCHYATFHPTPCTS